MADKNIFLGHAATYNYLKDYLGGLCISLSGLGGVSTVAAREMQKLITEHSDSITKSSTTTAGSVL